MTVISRNILISILIFFLGSKKSVGYNLIVPPEEGEVNVQKLMPFLTHFKRTQMEYRKKYHIYINKIQISPIEILNIIEGIAKTRTDLRTDIRTAHEMLETLVNNGDLFTLMSVMVIKSMALLYAFAFSQGYFILHSFKSVRSVQKARDCAELAAILAVFGVSVNTSFVFTNEKYRNDLRAQNQEGNLNILQKLQQYLRDLEHDIMKSVVLNYNWENREIIPTNEVVNETIVKNVNSFLLKWIYDKSFQILEEDNLFINYRLLESAGEMLTVRQLYSQHLILSIEKSNHRFNQEVLFKSYLINLLQQIEIQKVLYFFPGKTRKEVINFIQNYQATANTS